MPSTKRRPFSWTGADIEAAEAPAEGDEVAVAQDLVAEKQHRLRVPDREDAGKNGIVNRTEVAGLYGGTEGRAGWPNRKPCAGRWRRTIGVQCHDCLA